MAGIDAELYFMDVATFAGLRQICDRSEVKLFGQHIPRKNTIG